jgi:uncharacterized coiled-coil protein SlyX
MSNQENHIIVRLRISPELRDQIAGSAKTHNRSMSADMVARLEQSFSLGEITPNELISEVIGLNRLVDRLDETINILNERLKSLESKTP